jgi:tetratricopeptide (TPR) repeat protein
MGQLNRLRNAAFRMMLWLSRRDSLSFADIGRILKSSHTGKAANQQSHLYADDMLRAANALAAGDFAGARRSYVDLLRLMPMNPDAFFGAASASLAMGDAQQALLFATCGALLGEGRSDLMFLAAESLRQLGFLSMAAQGFQHVIAIPADSTEAKNVLRAAEIHLNMAKAALAERPEADRKTPDFINDPLWAARQLQELGISADIKAAQTRAIM